MGEKPGKVQALVVEFSADCTAADCTAIRAKSGEGGYSEAVESWRKGVYTSYTPILLYSGRKYAPYEFEVHYKESERKVVIREEP